MSARQNSPARLHSNGARSRAKAQSTRSIRLPTRRGSKIIKDDTLPGERHDVITMPDGTLERAAYKGRGTQLMQRLQRNIPPKSREDAIARLKDIAYARRNGNASERAQLMKYT